MGSADGQQFKRTESDRSGKRTKHQRIMRTDEMRGEWIYKGSERVKKGIGVLEGAGLKPLVVIKDCVLEGAVPCLNCGGRDRLCRRLSCKKFNLSQALATTTTTSSKTCCYARSGFSRALAILELDSDARVAKKRAFIGHIKLRALQRLPVTHFRHFSRNHSYKYPVQPRGKMLHIKL
ncbi:uncharacterized protein TNCV_1503681 [Trichonephila clavipes]|uniref:Uncharacterized protein n=1 Tax=Trichonephila clavipes TaxID=2585209 RepID=A0A8X6V8H5_TRICX|nr:uncharacterized protein TNCV_1503681 [Trichonephila clavipes]